MINYADIRGIIAVVRREVFRGSEDRMEGKVDSTRVTPPRSRERREGVSAGLAVEDINVHLRRESHSILILS